MRGEPIEEKRTRGKPNKEEADKRYYCFLFYILNNFNGVRTTDINRDFLVRYHISSSMQSKYPKMLEKQGIVFKEKDLWKVRRDFDTFKRIFNMVNKEEDITNYAISGIKKKIAFVTSKYFEFVINKYSSQLIIVPPSDDGDDRRVIKLIICLSPTALNLVMNDLFYSNMNRTAYTIRDYSGNRCFVQNTLKKLLMLNADKLKINNYKLIELLLNCMIIDYFKNLTYLHFIELYRNKYPGRWNKEIEENLGFLAQKIRENNHTYMLPEGTIEYYGNLGKVKGIVR